MSRNSKLISENLREEMEDSSFEVAERKKGLC